MHDLVLPGGLRGEAVLGDLEEEFQARCTRDGSAPARWWYRRQAWRVIRAYASPWRHPADLGEVRSAAAAPRRPNGLAKAL